MKSGWLIASSSLFLLVACSGAGGSDVTGSSDPTNPSGSSSSSSSSGSSSSTNVSSQAEQMNGGCPSSPQKLKGTRSSGSTCSTFADCKPSCCDCSNGDSYLAAACVDGVCATSETACAKAKKSFFCGETSSSSGGSSSGASSSGGSSSGGSSSGGSSSGGSSSSSGGTSGKTCVAGTYSSCYGSGMFWTGTECCVPGQQTCVDGTYSSCYGGPMTWTGTVCCLDVPVTCTSGTYSSCYGTGKHWTGGKCCME